MENSSQKLIFIPIGNEGVRMEVPLKKIKLDLSENEKNLIQSALRGDNDPRDSPTIESEASTSDEGESVITDENSEEVEASSSVDERSQQPRVAQITVNSLTKDSTNAVNSYNLTPENFDVLRRDLVLSESSSDD